MGCKTENDVLSRIFGGIDLAVHNFGRINILNYKLFWGEQKGNAFFQLKVRTKL